MEISKVIRNHGLTNVKVAEMLGTSTASFGNLISPNRNITVNNLRKIAQAIGCNITEFFEDEVTVQAQQDPEPTTVCPHCGKPIDVHITLSTPKE